MIMMSVRRLFIWAIVIIPLLVLVYSMLQITFSQVSLTINLQQRGVYLEISGEANLPDRTLLTYEVMSASPEARELDGVYATGVVVVSKQRYQATVDTSLIDENALLVSVRFEVYPEGPPQPPHIPARYGLHGERMSGANAMTADGRKWLEVSEIITLVPNS
jgi:hypothetical protein